ncbi:MAG: hypothetical protein ETSY2_32420, partial [Candidatus Entotheonella gemina]
QYGRDGTLFPLPVLSPDEVAAFRTGFETMEAKLGGNPTSMQMAQSHLYYRWAYDLATHPAILDRVEDIIGPNILVHSSTIFRKRPYDPSFVSWHQDGYYWDLDEPLLTSAWIALSNSTVDNGCMQVIPTSHKQCLPHDTHHDKHNMLTTGLEIAVDVSESEAWDVILQAGEMSLHHVNIIHGSKPSRSATPRIGFAIRFVAPQVQQGLDHYAAVLARGRDDYHHFRLLQELPSDDLEESIAAQTTFIHWLRTKRAAQMQSGKQG